MAPLNVNLSVSQLLASQRNSVPPLRAISEGTDVEIADAVLADLSEQYQSKIVWCDGQFYAYAGTSWQVVSEAAVKAIIYKYDRTKCISRFVVRLGAGKVDSILSVMHDRALEPKFFDGAPQGINCRSGFITFDGLGISTLSNHCPDHRQRHCLLANWTSGASWHNATLLNKFLQGCFGQDRDYQEKIALVGEICGMAALGGATALPNPKAIVLYGQTAANGKSEMLAMVSGLLPESAVCAIPPAALKESCMLYRLIGCQLNACAELGTSHSVGAEVFKQVVTGDVVTARTLYRSPVDFRPCALHLYATNSLPTFQGGIDRGIERRLKVLVEVDRFV